MIKLVYGSLLDSPKDSIILHQVNGMGKMGSGVAKQIREQYPSVYLKYKELCTSVEPIYLLGKAQMCLDNKSGRKVINLFAQYNYATRGTFGRRFTNYDAFKSALYESRDLINLSNKLSSEAIELSFPWNIGCCRGGGDMKLIYNLITTVLKDFNITFYCLGDVDINTEDYTDLVIVS